MKDRNILLIVTGSIAAYKAADLASKLKQAGARLRVVLSEGAREFITSTTFEGLTREPVFESTFESGRAMAHIDLARESDLTLVYPASANTLTRLAAGLAGDLVGTLYLAQERKIPFWIFPAMNPEMLQHPATQRALQTLRDDGATVFESASGRMACGEVGVGRLLEPNDVFGKIQTFFKKNQARVLITAGGTVEPIDSVRSIVNTSTGETGHRIALALQNQGASVTLLQSQASSFQNGISQVHRYRTFTDLAQLLEKTLKENEFDWVIHSAAVGDFSVAGLEDFQGNSIDVTTKVASSTGMRLTLKPNPKLVQKIKGWSKNPHVKLMSFKLEDTMAEPDFTAYPTSDWIVLNTLAGIQRGSDKHAGEVYQNLGGRWEPRLRFHTKTELTNWMGASL